MRSETGTEAPGRRAGKRRPAKTSGGSTAAVLWLMIALVFLPLVAIHVGARWAVQAQPAPAQSAPSAEPAKPLIRAVARACPGAPDAARGAVAEILFFHLQRQTLDRVLPTLLQRSLARGWRALVRAGSEERVRALDTLLWTYSDESFLAHAAAGDGEGADDPVVLTTGEANPNGATVLFVVDGAAIPDALDAYERVTLVFDGNDEDALVQARETWRAVKAKGLEATYWQEGESGGWEKKA